eukprot:gb/GFBE01026809.1/.p1 GENE.gb/GFBE01026809.1/~~gb/GFBE01026809.1/.p1  ORF type:complete len:417 (+),score=66.97 gb/GFBE01026809.1/:1-1251(+)
MGAAESSCSAMVMCSPEAIKERGNMEAVLSRRVKSSSSSASSWRQRENEEQSTNTYAWLRRHQTTTASEIIEGHQGLMLEIASFCIDSVQAHRRLSCLSVQAHVQMSFSEAAGIWRWLFRNRWPAFFDCLHHQGTSSWQGSYEKMLQGGVSRTLEVLQSEKKPGFAMSAMPATVLYDRQLKAYVASYISLSKVPDEVIPESQAHRLRFCPASAQQRLQPGIASAPLAFRSEVRSLAQAANGCYPHKVLEGLEGLEVGVDVEVQWKMQLFSSFGWWFGHLEKLTLIEGTEEATATITFPHLVETSRWFRLEVRVGSAEIQPCSLGGWTGGLRRVSETEKKAWMQVYPLKRLLTGRNVEDPPAARSLPSSLSPPPSSPPTPSPPRSVPRRQLAMSSEPLHKSRYAKMQLLARVANCRS